MSEVSSSKLDSFIDLEFCTHPTGFVQTWRFTFKTEKKKTFVERWKRMNGRVEYIEIRIMNKSFTDKKLFWSFFILANVVSHIVFDYVWLLSLVSFLDAVNVLCSTSCTNIFDSLIAKVFSFSWFLPLEKIRSQFSSKKKNCK